jgi:predicted DNA-binding protein with PD1-like motif
MGHGIHWSTAYDREAVHPAIDSYSRDRARIELPIPTEVPMRIQRFDDRYIVRIEAGERVVATLVGFLRGENVGFANLSAAGALSSARIGFWDPDQRAYDYRDFEEQLEVVSFVGNASLRDGEPFLHLHVALGRSDFSVVGGHLQEAIVHPTIEVWLRTEDVNVRRTKDPASGLDLLDLPPR